MYSFILRLMLWSLSWESDSWVFQWHSAMSSALVLMAETTGRLKSHLLLYSVCVSFPTSQPCSFLVFMVVAPHIPELYKIPSLTQRSRDFLKKFHLCFATGAVVLSSMGERWNDLLFLKESSISNMLFNTKIRGRARMGGC